MKKFEAQAWHWFLDSEKGHGKTHAIAVNPRKGYLTTLCGYVILYPVGFAPKQYRCKKCLAKIARGGFK